MTSGKGPLVLYVEDNPANTRLIERVLLRRRPDARLLTAVRGDVGLDLARERKPDLVLLDLNLPGLSGEELLRELRAHADTRAMPVVMVSGDAMPDTVERLEQLGVHAYLTKPLEIARLMEVLDVTLGHPGGA